jgi:hypothetical protein
MVAMTAVIVYYVICRSHIGYANIILEQFFHVLFIYLYLYKFGT